jgi:hypothetical protein
MTLNTVESFISGATLTKSTWIKEESRGKVGGCVYGRFGSTIDQCSMHMIWLG